MLTARPSSDKYHILLSPLLQFILLVNDAISLIIRTPALFKIFEIMYVFDSAEVGYIAGLMSYIPSYDSLSFNWPYALIPILLALRGFTSCGAHSLHEWGQYLLVHMSSPKCLMVYMITR